jgi:outer membrane murein-binding lipoprotein Lpp
MPFIVLLCGLLGGTLLSLLVISTKLAEGSFRITNLQSQLTQLSRQREQLQEQVARAQSAQMIGEQAYGLGMRPPGQLRFIDLKTGRVRTDAGTGAIAHINVPGYTP